jgi:hypothetical protein
MGSPRVTAQGTMEPTVPQIQLIKIYMTIRGGFFTVVPEVGSKMRQGWEKMEQGVKMGMMIRKLHLNHKVKVMARGQRRIGEKGKDLDQRLRCKEHT